MTQRSLELINEYNLVLELIYENSIESFVQDCLSYILKPNSSCSTTLAYLKWPYVFLKANICCIYYMILSFLDFSTMFYMSYVLCDT